MGINDNRFLIEILRDISDLPEEQMIEALRKSPSDVWTIMYMAYGDVELALPTTPSWRVDRITHRSFIEGRLEHINAQTSCGDLLSTETRKMVRLYVRGVHPTLTDKKRFQLWEQTLARLQEDEIELLEEIRVHRRLPEGLDRITKEIVRAALPGLLETVVPPENPAQPYSSAPGLLSPLPGEPDPVRVIDNAPPPPSTVTAVSLREQINDEAKRRYDEVYSRLRFA
jgi:hypothetical protein